MHVRWGCCWLYVSEDVDGCMWVECYGCMWVGDGNEIKLRCSRKGAGCMWVGMLVHDIVSAGACELWMLLAVFEWGIHRLCRSPGSHSDLNIVSMCPPLITLYYSTTKRQWAGRLVVTGKKWAGNSPDMNSCENLSGREMTEAEATLEKSKARNNMRMATFWRTVKRVLSDIQNETDYFQKLLLSVRKRTQIMTRILSIDGNVQWHIRFCHWRVVPFNLWEFLRAPKVR